MYNFEFLKKGHDCIPAKDAVKIKKSGVRINSALRHVAPLRSYVKIGIDAKAGVGCIKPVKDAHNAFSVGSEFGGKVAGRLMEVVGEHPIASVENGMIILRPRDTSIPAQPDQREEAEPVKAETEPLALKKSIQKKRGRKRPAEVLQACSNCHYSKPVEGKPGLVQCTNRTPAQNRAPDSWCFAYKSVADAKAEAEAELALRDRVMKGVR